MVCFRLQQLPWVWMGHPRRVSPHPPLPPCLLLEEAQSIGVVVVFPIGFAALLGIEAPHQPLLASFKPLRAPLCGQELHTARTRGSPSKQSFV